MSNESDQQLAKEIKDLKLEIAKLTAILTFKQLESEHPSLKKLAAGVDAQRSFLRREARDISQFAHEHLGDVPVKKGFVTLGAILGIGTIAYALLCYLGVLDHPGH